MNGKRSKAPLVMALIGAAVVAVITWLVIRGFSTPGPGVSSPKPSNNAPPPPPPEQSQGALDRARQLLRQNQAAQAESVLRAAIEKDAANAELHALLAETLLSLQRPVEAADAYEQALFAGMENAEIRFAAGSASSLAGRLDRAEEHYARAEQLAPDNPKHPLYLAQILRKLGRNEEAKAKLLRAATIDPTLAIAWGTLGAIGLEENNLSVAMGHVRRAREIEPGNATWRILEAKILRRQGQPEEALRLLMAMPDSDRLGDATILEEIGLNFGLLKRPADAAQVFAAAADRQPRNAELLYQTALWHERAGDRDAAAVFARRAAELGHEPAKLKADALSAELVRGRDPAGGKGDPDPNK